MFRDNELDTIEVSTSHVKLRVVCFILALALALGGIGYGVAQLIHKKEGYYEIKPASSDDAQQYATGVTFLYYMEGGSNEIGVQLNQLKDVYGTALLRAYKLLDAETEYEGYANIATLNASAGKKVQVGEELYNVLRDALNKTRERCGYNMFAGALYSEWNSILSLDDATEFDPANNGKMARRLKRLAEETAKLEHFELRFDESEHSVELWISPEYRAFLDENGFNGGVLDLNLLSEAYRITIARDELERSGFGNGYISSDSGLTLSLSAHVGGEYCMYALKDGQITQAARTPSEPGSACSVFRSFAMSDGEVMYHTFEKDGKALHRHPCFVTATGEFAEVLEASCAVRYDGSLADACYANVALYNAASREAVCDIADRLDCAIVCAFWDGSFYSSPAGFGR